MPRDAPVMIVDFSLDAHDRSPFSVRFRRHRRFGITDESGVTQLMANLLDEGVADTFGVWRVSDSVFNAASSRRSAREPPRTARSHRETAPRCREECLHRCAVWRTVNSIEISRPSLWRAGTASERAAAIAALGATHDLVVAFPMPTAQALGDDQIEPRANRLAFGKAEDPCGCRIPVADEARGVRVDHCIRAISDEVLEKPGREFSAS